jgi:hypothetical protein
MTTTTAKTTLSTSFVQSPISTKLTADGRPFRAVLVHPDTFDLAKQCLRQQPSPRFDLADLVSAAIEVAANSESGIQKIHGRATENLKTRN